MRRARYTSGAALVLTLFVVAIIFVAGLGFLSSSVSEYRAAAQAGLGAQSLALAEAGIQDALLKLQRDQNFPPQSSEDQLVYTYQDTLENSRGDTIGTYEVNIDRTAYVLAQQLLIIRSTGRLGTLAAPTAERTLEVEIDMNPDRTTYFRVVSWNDLGGF